MHCDQHCNEKKAAASKTHLFVGKPRKYKNVQLAKIELPLTDALLQVFDRGHEGHGAPLQQWSVARQQLGAPLQVELQVGGVVEPVCQEIQELLKVGGGKVPDGGLN